MKIYNTLNKQVEDFVPNVEGEIKMYTCGPTVYHFAHIGNLRTYIFEDILEKGLEYVGFNVKRVMNITDVGHLTSDADQGEDKMLKGAKRENKTVYEIADFYTQAFFDDCERLNIKRPEIVSKASDNIDVYIKMIENLLEKDIAYLSDGNIYFDISKATDYYKLSGKNPDDLLVGVRNSVEEDNAKRNQSDFVLWFTVSKFENQDMKWESPWGIGYPGWHIECSGIAYKYFGEKLDIHCGGVDNIFPHHTNEIAQSEAFIGSKWCNYWCHGEHLNDRSGKMSKSSGDFLTLTLLESKNILPLSYRYLCLNSHYRSQLVFSDETIEMAQNGYIKLKNKINSLNRNPDLHEDKIDYYDELFKDAIKNDLNTASMITTLYDVLKDSDLTDFSKLYLIEKFDKVLSLDLINEVDEHVNEEIEKLIVERNLAKANKDFALADIIRNKITSLGYKIIDSREGTKYERV